MNTSKIIVYLGPSLELDVAKRILPSALFRAPAKQSDILSDVENDRPSVIVLIDGCFHHNRSPWHKEILYALGLGVHVVGAASMGAIRAAECHQFGMVGIGDAFRYFKSPVAKDDEVAVAQSEDGRPLSLPMIDVRATLSVMLEDGDVSGDQFDSLIEQFECAYFPERTASLIRDTEIKGAFLKKYVPIKRNDAIKCLRFVRDNIATFSRKHTPQFEFSGGHLFDAQYERDRKYRTIEGYELPMSAIDGWAAVNSPGFESENWNAANRECALILCRVLGIRISSEIDTSGLSRVQVEDLFIRQLHNAIRASKVMRKNTKIYTDYLESRGEMEDVAINAGVHEKLVERLSPDFMSKPVADDAILNNFHPHAGIDQFLKDSGLSIQELKISLEKSSIVSGAIG